MIGCCEQSHPHRGKGRNATLSPPPRAGPDLGIGTPASPAAPRKPGVLVADDQESIRTLLSTALQGQGFVVWLAADGGEALNQYWHHRAAIDLVLLDVQMPGLDGPHTLAALRQLNPQVRCCFMSGALGLYTAEELRGLGAGGFLQKPFCLAEAGRVLGRLANLTVGGRAPA